MFTLNKEDIVALAAIPNVDRFSIPAFSNAVLLHRGRHVGLYISGYGVVLHPEFTEIQYFEGSHTLKVAKEIDQEIRYGCYSIKTKEFVIPLKYPLWRYWEEYKLFCSRM